MNQAVPRQAAPGVESVEDTLYLLRARVLLVALNVLAVTMPAICVILGVQAHRAGGLNTFTLVLCMWGLAFPFLRLIRPRLTFTTSAFALLAMLLVSAAMVAVRGGLTVGSVAVSVLIILLSALFFGRRGAVWGLISVVLMIAVSGVLFVQEYLPPTSPELWDQMSGGVWLRQGFIIALLGVVMAVTELYVVERLAHQVEVHQHLAAREREQRLALERSERERLREREQREQAQRALEQSRRIEALARMAGGVAHDFNNALTVIVGGAEMAKLRRQHPDEVEECLDEVLRAAGGAAELSRRLLMLGRHHIAKPKPTSIAGLLNRLEAPMRRVLADDVHLVLESPEAEVVALVDEGELERALLNLLLNAGDAMPRGGTVSIAWRGTTVTDNPNVDDGRYVEISVSDTGQGMNRETLERIFDPFFTTKSDKGGTGLGLATVYAFANESHGAIDAVSTPSQGTTFTLLLPETEAVGAVATASPAEPVRVSRSAGARVLVVEDRPDVRASMARTLSHHGFTVIEAHDGDAALQLLVADQAFALMCIDGVMPGLQTATVIERAKDFAPSMPVLVCSGHVQEELLRRGISTGRYAFLSKPFTAQQLLASVLDVLGSPGNSATPMPPAT